MIESPCIHCGEMCLHTDEDVEPMCDLCQEARMWMNLILDVAAGKVEVTDGFIESIGKEEP